MTAQRGCNPPHSPCSTRRGDGIVVSAIQDAGSARVYVKRVQAGAAADVAFGPEEQAAVAAARSGAERRS